MKLIGFREGRQTMVGALLGDKIAPIAEVSAFYADLPANLAKARAATAGTVSLAGIEERPAITPSARVLCSWPLAPQSLF